jgi:hypothetical protein
MSVSTAQIYANKRLSVSSDAGMGLERTMFETKEGIVGFGKIGSIRCCMPSTNVIKANKSRSKGSGHATRTKTMNTRFT